MEYQPINLRDKLSKFSEHWSPKIISQINDYHFKLAKVQGEFVWHSHENEDELFQVLKGTLHMQFRDRTEVVNEGEIIVVPKGVEHCPSTKNDEIVHLLLFEKLTTAHTGNVKHPMTQTKYPKI